MQVKWLGLYWRVWFASWSEFHARDCEPRMRKAWWFLWHQRTYGKSCYRLCGITLHGRPTPWRDA